MGLDPALRDQLIQARETIRAQLDELYLRSAPYGHGNTPPPDYRGIIAEFEHDLGEIEETLGADERDEAK